MEIKFCAHYKLNFQMSTNVPRRRTTADFSAKILSAPSYASARLVTKK